MTYEQFVRGLHQKSHVTAAQSIREMCKEMGEILNRKSHDRDDVTSLQLTYTVEREGLRKGFLIRPAAAHLGYGGALQGAHAILRGQSQVTLTASPLPPR